MASAFANIKTRLWRCILTSSLLLSLFCQSLIAGGGEQNTVIVVNGNSPNSRRIANEYIALRNIPAINVIVLNDISSRERIYVDEFREKILSPILNQIAARRLQNQIDYIVYSADFPTAIGFASDVFKNREPTPLESRLNHASITSLTYFYQYTMAANTAHIDLEANHYYRRTMEETLAPVNAKPEYAAAIRDYNSGKHQQALDAFESLAANHKGTPSLLYWQARCQAHLNHPDQARDLLLKVLEAGWPFHDDTLIDPAFSGMRQESWFKEIGERIPPCPPGSRPTVGFNAGTGWTRDGLIDSDPRVANRYVISTMLARTRDDLMSVDEALAQIRRTVAADFTHPNGTMYFMRNSDVRSKTREPGFEGAVTDLNRLGVKAKVVSGVLPMNTDDVIGLMIGKSQFKWDESGSKIKAGAICENLTSYGGMFYFQKDPQTRLTEFLRAGAAGSSGTVTEPYAIQNKFPHPYIQVHYARGASLGEAFYQSVQSPYQLLIIGDALCRPFADPLEFTLTGVTENQVISDQVTLTVEPATSNKHALGRIEIYVDGLLHGRYAPDDTILLNSDRIPLANGYHDLQVVAVDDTPIATQTSKSIGFYVGSKDLIEFNVKEGSTYKLEGKITGTIRAPNATRILLLHNMEHLADVEAAEAQIDVDCKQLGKGPARLQCVAFIDGKVVLSKRIEVLIE